MVNHCCATLRLEEMVTVKRVLLLVEFGRRDIGSTGCIRRVSASPSSDKDASMENESDDKVCDVFQSKFYPRL